VLTGLLAAAGLASVQLARGERVPVRLVPARRSSLVLPVLCLGTLQPPPGGVLHAAEASVVGAILVAEGDRVQKGAPLVRLNDPDLVAKAIAAKEELQQLSGAHAVAVAELAGEKREAAYRKQVLEADARLLEQAAISRSAYEADELALRQAEARVQAAEARAESLGAASGGSNTRLALAAARARDLESRVAALTVRAPAPGFVYGLPTRVGEAVTAGQVVANVVDPDQPSVALYVDPPDLPQVATGQRITITFDGLPNQEWEGRVTSVAPALREASGREVARVLGTIADPAHRLPFNASVSARIVVGERSSALLVPRAALHREENRRFVYGERAGRAVRRDVSVGLVGLTDVEVTSGLADGETVLLPGEVPLSEGLRIAPLRDR
jgi:HlyD family secretion protein